jgi:hypothetical protein
MIVKDIIALSYILMFYSLNLKLILIHHTNHNSRVVLILSYKVYSILSWSWSWSSDYDYLWTVVYRIVLKHCQRSTDWLIDYCLTPSDQSFIYIQDENNYNNIYKYIYIEIREGMDQPGLRLESLVVTKDLVFCSGYNAPSFSKSTDDVRSGALSRHVTHSGPRSRFPYYNLTVPLREDSLYPPSRDALSSSSTMKIWFHNHRDWWYSLIWQRLPIQSTISDVNVHNDRGIVPVDVLAINMVIPTVDSRHLDQYLYKELFVLKYIQNITT